jgi:hypothetical protein
MEFSFWHITCSNVMIIQYTFLGLVPEVVLNQEFWQRKATKDNNIGNGLTVLLASRYSIVRTTNGMKLYVTVSAIGSVLWTH